MYCYQPKHGRIQDGRPRMHVRIINWFLQTTPRMILLTLIMSFLIFRAFAAIENAYYNPSLDSGIVIAKIYDSGHDWSSALTIGNYQIIRHHRNNPKRFLVQVRRGNFLDTWEIPEEQWISLREGDYIEK